MKMILSSAAALLIFAADMAAASPARPFSEKQLAQQQRMRDCAVESKRLGQKGAVHMAFMQSCLKGGQVTVEVGGETATSPERPRKPQALPERVD